MSAPPDWWKDPRLAYAEGARVGYLEGLREALEVARDLYGPWKFDAADVVRGLEARGRWPLEGAGPTGLGGAAR